MKKIFQKSYIALLLLFCYAPIIYMIVFSFNDSRSLTKFAGFSLRWYNEVLNSNEMMKAIYYTFFIAIVATVVATIVGTITAIGLSKSKKIVRDIVLEVNNLPMLNPDIVTAISLMLLFITVLGSGSKLFGLVTMLLAHIMFCIPYVILSILPKLRQLDSNLAEAALDLGATPWQALMKVIVPQIIPGIISGALVAFTMSVDDFVISYFVTGNGVRNVSIQVYTMSKRVNPSINAISTLMIAIITIVLIIINVIPLLKERRLKSN